VFSRLRGVFPDWVIGCPLLKNTREAAETGRSFFFDGFGVSAGRTERSDCSVIGRDPLVKRREMEDLRPRALFVLIVRSLKGTTGAGAESK
jgi:hypothetical protein